MNLLFYRYGSICEPDLLEAFAEYGLNITECTEEVTNKDLLPADCARLVGQLLDDGNFSFVFSINFFPAVSDVCHIYKIPYLCLIVDSPIMELYSNSILHPTNRIFLFDRCLYDEFHPLNPDCIFHLPLATNVRRWDRVIAADHSDRFHSELSFVGSLYTEKCPYDRLSGISEELRGYLDGIMEAQLHVYGYYFIEELLNDAQVQEFLEHLPGHYVFPPNSRANDRANVAQLYIGNKLSAMERTRLFAYLSRYFSLDLYTGSDTSKLPKVHNCGRVKTLSEMPLVFSRSRINLNITSKAIRSGLPLRIFDVLGCGGFLITNYQAELMDLFRPGEHLAAYTSFEELKDLILYYSEHESERREIAHNGYEEVKEHHTYMIRVGQMITQAFANL